MANKYVLELFSALAERFYKENGLSDITYVMCKASARFSLFFLELMFPGEFFSGKGTWEREFGGIIDEKGEGSRIDFYYSEDERKYVIENKIFDQDTHDEQYRKAFPDSDGYKRSFIANYKYNGTSYFHCETWKKLLRSFSEYAKRNKGEESFLFEGYILYLTRIVNYMEAEEMDFSNVKSIRSFFITVNEFVDKTKDIWHLSLCRDKDPFWGSADNWLGKYYFDNLNDWFFICLELKEEKPLFAIWIMPKYKNDPLFNQLMIKEIKSKRTSLIDRERISSDKEWGLGLYLKQDIWFDVFFGTEKTLSEQQDCIDGFLNEVFFTVHTVINAK